MTLALIALLTTCLWFDPAVPIEVLPPAAFDDLAEVHGYPRLRLFGLATWLPSAEGPEDCRITLREPLRFEVACHEYKHCAEGSWHIPVPRDQ